MGAHEVLHGTNSFLREVENNADKCYWDITKQTCKVFIERILLYHGSKFRDQSACANCS